MKKNALKWNIPPINTFKSQREYPDDLIAIESPADEILDAVQVGWLKAARELTPYYKMHPIVLFYDCTVLNKKWAEKLREHCKNQQFTAHIDYSIRVNMWIWHSLEYEAAPGVKGLYEKRNRDGVLIKDILHEANPPQQQITVVLSEKQKSQITKERAQSIKVANLNFFFGLRPRRYS
jgi:hypothetical protein